MPRFLFGGKQNHEKVRAEFVVFVLMVPPPPPQLLLKLIEDRAERKSLCLPFLELWEVTENFQALVFPPVPREQLFVSSSRM